MLKNGMPNISVRDLAIQKRENDLVVGTFGRGIYVLDDYSSLREFKKENVTKNKFNKKIYNIKNKSIKKSLIELNNVYKK